MLEGLNNNWYLLSIWPVRYLMPAILFHVMSVLVLLTLCYVFLSLSPDVTVYVSFLLSRRITTLEPSSEVSFCNFASNGTNSTPICKELGQGQGALIEGGIKECWSGIMQSAYLFEAMCAEPQKGELLHNDRTRFSTGSR